MSITFNADEIFEIAEQIERNGARFYRRAAADFAGESAHKRLLELAEWEDGHEKAFAAMRLQLSQGERTPTVYDPEGEAAAYLRAFAGGHVFDINADPSERLTGSETLAEVLRTALGLEKDSIVFYLGIKNIVPENLGKAKIDAIIEEEMSHVTLLSRELASQAG